MKNLFANHISLNIGKINIACTDDENAGCIRMRDINVAISSPRLESIDEKAAKLGVKFSHALDDSELLIIPIPHGSTSKQRADVVADMSDKLNKMAASEEERRASTPRPPARNDHGTVGKRSGDMMGELLTLALLSSCFMPPPGQIHGSSIEPPMDSEG